MMSSAKLAWLQLTRERLRFAVALAGVAFAVILVFMQLGFQDALFTSAVTLHHRLRADLVIINSQSAYVATLKTFSRRRLYQALADPGVAEVTPVYARLAPWKNPYTGKSREIFVLGIDPDAEVFDIPDVQTQRLRLHVRDHALFDRYARPEFGPVAADMTAGRPVSAEVLGTRLQVDGLFPLGVSFGIDGTILVNTDTFRGVFHGQPAGLISLGLIRLQAGADAAAVRDRLRTVLPPDVAVLTLPEYVAREVEFWDTSTPIGYALGFGVLMGWCVGAIIVYQILFTDVTEHLPSYATLKAMGYPNRYLFGVVLMEAFILAVLGYLPAVAVSRQLYAIAAAATRLPMLMRPDRIAQVLVLTILMCGVSGALAMRKIRTADPAELF